MQEVPRRRRQRLLVLPLVVALVVLTAAVSSWAADSPSGTTNAETPSFVPVQESEDERDRGPGHDCPERDGEGSADESQPDASEL